MTRILITGDRDWTNRDIIYTVLYEIISKIVADGRKVIVTEGEAEGADKISAWAVQDLAAHFPVLLDPHPAQWYRWDEKKQRQYFFRGAGPERNNEMLALKDPPPAIVLAFHNNLDESKGTRHCVLGAIGRKYDVQVFAENGLAGPEPYASVFIAAQDGRPEQILQEALHRLHPHTW